MIIIYLTLCLVDLFIAIIPIIFFTWLIKKVWTTTNHNHLEQPKVSKH